MGGSTLKHAKCLVVYYSLFHQLLDHFHPSLVSSLVLPQDALIHALLSKTMPASLAHISGLRNVTVLKLEHAAAVAAAPGRSAAAVAAGASSSTFQPSNDAPFCCPITGAAFNGRFKFVVFRETGMAVAERALREVPAVVAEMVGRKTTDEDWLIVNATGEALLAAQVSVYSGFEPDVCAGMWACTWVLRRLVRGWVGEQAGRG